MGVKSLFISGSLNEPVIKKNNYFNYTLIRYLQSSQEF